MDLKSYLVLHYLPKLIDIEEIFISLVHVVIKACQLAKGNARCKGNVLSMEQDIQKVIDKLSLMLLELPIFIV